MLDDDHTELLDALLDLEGFVVLSGYPSDLYTDRLKSWTLHQVKSRISANRGSSVRTECVWLNPACSAAINLKTPQQRMFA